MLKVKGSNPGLSVNVYNLKNIIFICVCASSRMKPYTFGCVWTNAKMLWVTQSYFVVHKWLSATSLSSVHNCRPWRLERLKEDPQGNCSWRCHLGRKPNRIKWSGWLRSSRWRGTIWRLKSYSSCLLLCQHITYEV